MLTWRSTTNLNIVKMSEYITNWPPIFQKYLQITITRVCWCETAVLPWMVMNIKNCHTATNDAIDNQKKAYFINQVQNKPLSSVNVDTFEL